MRQNVSVVTVSPVAGDKITAEDIKLLKGKGLPALTAYDYGMAKIIDACDIPLILVGDSLGMVVLGYPDTTHVTLAEIEHHVRAVARARPRALLAADMPFNTYATVEDALATARRLMAAGAEAVKCEGGREVIDQVEAINAEGIGFVGHLGMLPQRVHEEGGYRIKGKVEAERQDLLADAKALEAAGAMGIVLELVKRDVAREITDTISIPTIGIGSGDACDGQILVTTDLWGTSPDFIPKHVNLRPNLAGREKEIINEWIDSLNE